MAVRALHAELSAVRALVADGLAEVTGATSDPGRFWIRSACARLALLDEVLVEAAGVPQAWIRLPVATVACFATVATAVALAGLAGLGIAGTLLAAGVALLVLAAATPWVWRRAVRALGRRRLGGLPDKSPAVLLHDVPESLIRARGRLVSATLRQAGSGHWSVAELRHAARADPVIRRLAHADLLLCQAIDCLERHLDDLANGWP
ncbi:hypothetical protein [Actinoplanes sp. NBRC 101535]|uniref:hypothetical protein n=1 Tax=Actinoplanes sp. NBRC 101535 TaxID=3032196 RepID=UPI0024A17D74|nr:hypothetical protein [Actinoplanes sp. NBRC 101535]GLY04591.1 hypothetical protein Acsp01_49700 [Actinoplanes sp. NBRC 101535]